MSKYQTDVVYNLKTKLDDSGISKLLSSLRTLEQASNIKLQIHSDDAALQKTVSTVSELRSVLSKSFNADLGILDVNKFNKELAGSTTTLSEVRKELTSLGPSGQRAFTDVASSVLKVNTGVRQSNELLSKMANTMANTVRWGITAGIFQNITAQLSKAVSYVRDLDTSLNGIRIVTGKSKEDMTQFAVQAGKAAKALSTTTLEYTEASRIFYEQGLGDQAVAARTDVVVKAAQVAHQTTTDMADQMTGIWNGYKASNQNVETFADKMAATAAYSASNFEELSKAINKVASVANNTGVSFDQLNAMISTTVSITKAAPENIGTAYKTIFARLGDLKANGAATDETGFTVKLGTVSTQLKTMGVDILDTNGQLKNMGEIVDQVGGKWQTWTKTQQMAAAQAMAGKRQYNNLVALFDNWDMYNRQLSISQDSLGALDQQQAVYAESTEAHYAKMTTAAQGFYKAFLNVDTINSATDAATAFIDVFTNLVTLVGGGGNALLGLGAIAMKVFNTQIANGIAGVIKNFRLMSVEAKQADAVRSVTRSFTEVFKGGSQQSNTAVSRLVAYAKEMSPYLRQMTEEQLQQYNAVQDQNKAAGIQLDNLIDQNKALTDQWNLRSKIQLTTVETGPMAGSVTAAGGKQLPTANKVRTTGDMLLRNSSDLNQRHADLSVDPKSGDYQVNKVPNLKQYAIDLRDAAEKSHILETATKGEVAEYNKVVEALEKIEQKRNGGLSYNGATKGGTTHAYNAEVDKLNDALIEMTSSAREAGTALSQNDKAFIESAADADKAQAAIKQASIAQAEEKADAVVQNKAALWTGVADAAMGVAFAIQTLSNLGSVWASEDTTIGQKLLETFTSIAMVLPMVVSSFASLAPAIIAYNVATQQKIALDAVSIALSEDTSAATIAEGVAKLTKNGFTQDEIALLLVKNGLTPTEVAGALEVAAATDVESVATGGLIKSLIGLQAAGGGVLWAIEAIVVVVGAAIVAFNIYRDGVKKMDEAQIKAGQDAQTYIQNVNGLKETYDGLSKTYHDTKTGRDELVAGAQALDAALGSEELDILALTGQWGAYNTALKQTIDDKLALQASIMTQADAAATLEMKWNLAYQAIKDYYGVIGEGAGKFAIGDFAGAGQTVKNAWDSATGVKNGLAQSILKDTNNEIDNKTSQRDLLTAGKESLIAKGKGLNSQEVKDYTEKIAKLNSELTTLAGRKATIDKGGAYTAAATADFEATRTKLVNDNPFTGKTSEQYEDWKKNILGKMSSMGKDVTVLGSTYAQNFGDGLLTNIKDVGVRAAETLKESLTSGQSKMSKADSTSIFKKLGKGDETKGAQVAIRIGINSTRTQPEIQELISHLNAPGKLDKVLVSIKTDTTKFNVDTINQAMDTLAKGGTVTTPLKAALEQLKPGITSLDTASSKYFNTLFTMQQKNVASLKADGKEKEANAAQIKLETSLENNLAESQSKVEKAQKAVNDAAKKWGQDSGTYKTALANLSSLKEHLDTVKVAYIATKLQQDHFSASISEAAAAILVMGKHAAELNLTALSKELKTAGDQYDNLTAKVLENLMTQQKARDAMTKIANGGNSDNSTSLTTIGRTYLTQRIKDIKAEAAAIKKGLSEGLADIAPVSADAGSTKEKATSTTPSDTTIAAVKSEFDAFYNINKLIAELKVKFDDLVEAQKKLTGADLIKNLNAQLAIIQKQVQAQKDKQRLQELDQKQLQTKMKKDKVKFDVDGDVSNYQTVVKAAEAKVNKDIKIYNATKTKKAKAKAKTVETAASRDLDRLRNEIAAYDTLQSGMADTQQALDDFAATARGLTLQKFSISLEVSTNFAEAQKKWDTFRENVIEDKDMDKALNKLNVSFADLSSYFNEVGNANLNKVTSQLQTVNTEIEKMKGGKKSSVFGDDMASAITLRDTLLNQLEDGLTNYKTLIEDIKKSTLDWVTQTADSFDKLKAQFDYIGSSLKHQESMMKLLYGEQAYSQMDQFYKAQSINNNAELTFLKNQLQSLMDTRDNIDKATNPDLWNALNLQVENSQTDLNTLLESSVEGLVAQYTNSVNALFEAFANQYTNGLGLDKVAEDWTMINKNSEVYLDTVSATYSINQLQDKILQSISDSTDPASQEKLNQLMAEQLKQLREKGELTQRDLDRANESYDITLKQIALENAQNNKSTMKLKRDSQGNYGYVYVADQKAELKAQQDLLTAEKTRYDNDKKAFEESQTNYQDTFKNYSDKAKAIALDTTTSEAQKKTDRATLDAQYGALLQKQTAINETAKQNYTQSTMDQYAQLYGKDSKEYQAFLDNKDAAMSTSDARWNSSLQGMIDKIGGSGGFSEVSNNLWTGLTTASQDYQASLNALGTSAGTDITDLNTPLTDAVTQTQSLADQGDTLVTSMGLEGDAIANVVVQLQAYTEAMNGAVEAAKKAVAVGFTASNSAAGGVANVSEADINSGVNTGVSGATPPTGTQFGIPDVYNTGGVGDESGDTGGTNTATKTKTAAAKKEADREVAADIPYKMGGNTDKGIDCSHFVWRVINKAGFDHPYTSTAYMGTNSKFPSGKGKDISIGWSKPGEISGSKYGHAVIRIDGEQYASSGSKGVHRNDSFSPKRWMHPAGYETGGYTGEWDGTDGKLAILHKKEVVLKEGDTSNLLTAVATVRDLASKLKSGAFASVSNFAAQILSPQSVNGTGLGTIEQTVTIQAEFPGVTSAVEIEKAFDNIVGTASQYVNKSTKNN